MYSSRNLYKHNVCVLNQQICTNWILTFKTFQHSGICNSIQHHNQLKIELYEVCLKRACLNHDMDLKVAKQSLMVKGSYFYE